MADEPNKTPSSRERSSTATATRSHRRRRTGTVVSDRCDKSITVVVNYLMQVPKYGKYIRRRTRLHVHDEANQAKVGDIVEIAECRPISRTKSWRLLRVITPAAGQ
jgi:small subunit ribosomal protein S17